MLIEAVQFRKTMDKSSSNFRLGDTVLRLMELDEVTRNMQVIPEHMDCYVVVCSNIINLHVGIYDTEYVTDDTTILACKAHDLRVLLSH